MLRRHSSRRQAGFSLVELMVGIVIGLIIVAAAASVYITAVRGGSDTLRSAKLNMELRGAMDLMVSEIRRAGYTPLTTNLTNSPFMLANTNLTLVGTDCLLFAYDSNGNSTTDTADFFGFRRNTSDASISMRQGADTGSTPSTSDGCSIGTDSWERITDPNSVEIDNLSFAITYQCWNAQDWKNADWSPNADANVVSDEANQACVAGQAVYDTANAAVNAISDLVEVRNVTITLTGHHKSDATTSMTLGPVSVRVRNDRVLTVP